MIYLILYIVYCIVQSLAIRVFEKITDPEEYDDTIPVFITFVAAPLFTVIILIFILNHFAEKLANKAINYIFKKRY